MKIGKSPCENWETLTLKIGRLSYEKLEDSLVKMGDFIRELRYSHELTALKILSIVLNDFPFLLYSMCFLYSIDSQC